MQLRCVKAVGLSAQAQVEGQTAKQKEALYRAALQDLTLFKSRTSAALLQASTQSCQSCHCGMHAEPSKTTLHDLHLHRQRRDVWWLAQAKERADKEMADANAMQAQYEAAWAGAEATHAQGRQLLDSLTKVKPAHRGLDHRVAHIMVKC